MRACALIRNNFNSARSADTRVRVSIALNGISSAMYAVLYTSDGTPHTTARGGQSCSKDAQANSCYIIIIIN